MIPDKRGYKTFEYGQQTENPLLSAAIIKDLLTNPLEKQNIPSERIGSSSDKLREISQTITPVIVRHEKRERIISDDNQTIISAVQQKRIAQIKAATENKSIFVKTTMQFAQTR